MSSNNDVDFVLLKDKIRDINASFIKDGWITLYDSNDTNDTKTLVYCCLVSSRKLKSYMTNRDWHIGSGIEGKPSVFSQYKNGKEIQVYETYSEAGIEPFLFSKHFHFDGGYDKYVDISEEFVLYFKLYEKGNDKQNRSYYYIEESGELDEVISIKPLLVKVKLRYLLEYLFIRKMHISVCFDYLRHTLKGLSELKLETIDTEIVEKNKIYNFYVEPSRVYGPNQTQSGIHGKVIISPNKNKNQLLHFDIRQDYESYITGYDEFGNEVYQDCSRTNEKYFIATYFKKEVLDKYYNDPKYTVTGMEVSSDFFRLKIDNNHNDYVFVFLVELSALPRKEQLHWKHYNIAPKEGMGISSVYYETMVEGNWAKNPVTPDLYFKHRFNEVNEKWFKKYGWYIYKPLSKKIEYRFTSLHIPTSNNIKSFCEQMLSMVIITIDSLNEEELSKYINVEEGDKGIAKFQKFLTQFNNPMPDMIEFLRNLQSLRSGLAAHRLSSNKQTKKSFDYFNIDSENYTEIATQVFYKSIHTLNSLDKYFLSE